MENQTPSIGRVIHVVKRSMRGPVHRPAMICEIGEKEMMVAIFPGNEEKLYEYDNRDDTGERIGSWHWPERVS